MDPVENQGFLYGTYLGVERLAQELHKYHSKVNVTLEVGISTIYFLQALSLPILLCKCGVLSGSSLLPSPYYTDYD